MRSIVEELFGNKGKMLSLSKNTYRSNYPQDLIVFNGNICTSEKKLWYGDLNITKSFELLGKLSEHLGETIYVLREMDARFENENNPLIDKFVLKMEVDGRSKVNS